MWRQWEGHWLRRWVGAGGAGGQAGTGVAVTGAGAGSGARTRSVYLVAALEMSRAPAMRTMVWMTASVGTYGAAAHGRRGGR
jgi:hypothetical protein